MKKWIWLAIPAALAAVIVLLPSENVRSAFFTSENQPTLVIDAGHGGFDGGAVSPDGVTEQGINLRIAQSAEALAGFFSIPTVMTRTDEGALNYDEGKSIRENKVADIRERRRIAEETENAVFLSIHLNKFEQSQYHGAQVFYSPNDPRSKALAETLQATLVSQLEPDNQRAAKKATNTIYLMKKLECPAVVVECGFLSNPAEAEKLQQPEYQKQLALCIIGGWLACQGEFS